MAKKKTQVETMQARVLGGFTLDGVQYNPDDIIEADPKMIGQLGSSVDADPSAVEYCIGLDGPVIKRHESKEPEPQESEEENKESESDAVADSDQAGN